MTVCKILFKGKSLKEPIEKLLICLEEISKNPFVVTWKIDGVIVDAPNDLDMMLSFGPSKSSKEESTKAKYAKLLGAIKVETTIVELNFKISQDPPFSLVNNIHHIFRQKGLKTSEIVYHSHKGCYGYQKFLEDGTIVTDSRSREEEMTTDSVDLYGLPVSLEGIDLNSSSTFIESVPNGKFAEFLKEHGMQY